MKLLTLPEACTYLRHGSTWVRAHAAELGAIRLPGKLLFDVDSLDAWLARHRTQTIDTVPAEPELTRITEARNYGRGPINPVTGQKWHSDQSGAR